MHSTIMRGDVVTAAAGYLYPMLEKTEDADSFVATAGTEMRSVAADAIAYGRAPYLDECGRNRYPADELLGMPKGARIAADAFLWMCRRAASVSYRKTAAEFAGVSGVAVNPMLPWRCVQREADLIRAEMECLWSNKS